MIKKNLFIFMFLAALQGEAQALNSLSQVGNGFCCAALAQIATLSSVQSAQGTFNFWLNGGSGQSFERLILTSLVTYRLLSHGDLFLENCEYNCNTLSGVALSVLLSLFLYKKYGRKPFDVAIGLAAMPYTLIELVPREEFQSWV